MASVSSSEGCIARSAIGKGAAQGVVLPAEPIAHALGILDHGEGAVIGIELRQVASVAPLQEREGGAEETCERDETSKRADGLNIVRRHENPLPPAP